MVETLEKIYKKWDYAQARHVFLKTLNNLKSPIQENWDNLSQEMKDYYKDFAGYKVYIENQNSIIKEAIKHKLIDRRELCKIETLFTAEEKIQYKNEFNDVISVIKEIK